MDSPTRIVYWLASDYGIAFMAVLLIILAITVFLPRRPVVVVSGTVPEPTPPRDWFWWWPFHRATSPTSNPPTDDPCAAEKAELERVRQEIEAEKKKRNTTAPPDDPCADIKRQLNKAKEELAEIRKTPVISQEQPCAEEKAEVERLNTSATERDQENDRLKVQLHKSNDLTENLRHELEKARILISESEKRLASNAQRLVDLTSRLSKAGDVILSLQSELDGLRNPPAPPPPNTTKIIARLVPENGGDPEVRLTEEPQVLAGGQARYAYIKDNDRHTLVVLDDVRKTIVEGTEVSKGTGEVTLGDGYKVQFSDQLKYRFVIEK